MTSPAEILAQNDKNMKKTKDELSGIRHLLRDVITFIDKHKREEEERWKAHSDHTPPPTRGEVLVAKRSEAQKKKKTKRPDDEIECPLDADGAHQPVRVDQWSDEPGPLDDGSKVWDRRMFNMNKWGQKQYRELFRYLELSLFGGALQPTDSLIGMKQLMERCFRYNTGAGAVE